jgi:hypothetical protein
MNIRHGALFTAIGIATGLSVSTLRAACPGPVAMFNGGGYPIWNCPDGRPVVAYAWQPGNPVPTNTGLEDIACEADTGQAPCNTMPGTNFAGDSRVGIATDWSTPGINGCPLGNASRIFISLQCNSILLGNGVTASISGQCSTLGYSTEAFYDYNNGDPILDIGSTTGRNNGRPVVQNYTLSGGMEIFTVKVDPPAIVSDCSPGSVAEVYVQAGYCADTDFDCPNLVQPSRGNLYSFTGPCSDWNPAVRDKSAWTPRTVDAAGNAVVSLPIAPSGQCNYVGTTTVVAGQESPFITGYVVSPPPIAASPSVESLRATKKGSSVEVAFSTPTELGLAGFNVYAAGKARQGELKLNHELIGARGVGGSGYAYSLSFPTADFKGSRSVIVELVMMDLTTLRADPVDF